jgi:cytochrome d ubiquinol oxidase subunit I
MDIYLFWVKIFALTFALGVVSGLTMSFQFGTNWSGFMKTVGNVAGPLLAYEVMTAFFLEATFLGVMLFGMRRVSPNVHLASTVIVAFGTTMSVFWIIALNSWMHTPAGFEMVNGKAHVVSWLAVIFNPSFPYKLSHTLVSSGLTAAFMVAGVSAYRFLRGQRTQDIRVALKTGVYLAAMLIPLQMFLGDLHGLNTMKYQPAKLAAMEGIWTTQKGVPMVLFGVPDEKEKKTHWEVSIPKLASLYLTHDLNGEVKGLNEFDKTPPVGPVFYAFRAMIGVGVLMLLVSGSTAFWLYRKGELPKPALKVLVAMTFSGWVAVIAGWYVTEIGRQPWLVTGVLTTAQAASPIAPRMVASTLIMYLTIYGALTMAYIGAVFHLARTPKKKPG